VFDFRLSNIYQSILNLYSLNQHIIANTYTRIHTPNLKQIQRVNHTQYCIKLCVWLKTFNFTLLKGEMVPKGQAEKGKRLLDDSFEFGKTKTWKLVLSAWCVTPCTLTHWLSHWLTLSLSHSLTLSLSLTLLLSLTLSRFLCYCN